MGLEALTWQAWLVAGLIVLMLGVLAHGRIGADLVVLGVVAVLALTGIVNTQEALRGFSNPGVITVALLFVVAAGLKETGAITLLSQRILGRPTSVLQAQLRLLLPVTLLSAFINNTPIVAVFMPIISTLCRRTGIAPSKLFMPLSYAAILGGVATLIGTSTNVVVAGLVADAAKTNPALPEFNLFTITWVGLPIAVVGVAYLLLFGRRLLPGSSDLVPAQSADKQYTTAMRVAPDSPIVARTVEAAGLRHLPGLFLSRIERSDQTIIAAPPTELLRAGDTLVFVGNLESVVDLQKIKGLLPVADDDLPNHYRPQMQLIEAVISPASPLVGSSIRDAGIRTRYGAVVVAVNRHGQRLGGKIGSVVLVPGDALLLEADKSFAARYRDSRDFYLVSALEGAAAPRHERAWAAIAVLFAVILGLSFAPVDEVFVALAGAAAMVALRCCTGPQARSSVDWQTLLVIAGSFAVGRAMEKTGLAAFIADNLLGYAAQLGPWFLLGFVYFLAMAFTALINNNAAAILMFPIIIQACATQNLSPLPFLIAMTVAASCEFSTPIGYQTNLMVMGPGGYRWLDFARFGLPLNFLCMAVCVGIVPWAYGPLSL